MIELLNCAIQDDIGQVSVELCETEAGVPAMHLYNPNHNPSARVPSLVFSPFDYGPEWYTALSSDPEDSFGASMADQWKWDMVIIGDHVVDLPASACPTGFEPACAAGGTFTLADRIADGLYVLDAMEDEYGYGSVIVGGYVGGAIAATALLDNVAESDPERIKGVWLWNGSLVGAPATQAYNGFGCFILGLFLGAGQNVLPSGPAFAAMLEGAELTPNGDASALAAVFGLPPGSYTFEALFYIVFTTHVDSPQWPTPTFRFTTGNAEDGLTGVFASHPVETVNEQDVYSVRHLVGPYTSVKMLEGIICGLAGDTTYTSNLGNYSNPVYMLGSTFGFGPDMQAMGAQMPNADIDSHFLFAAGESDRFFSSWRFKLADKKLGQWAHSL